MSTHPSFLLFAALLVGCAAENTSEVIGSASDALTAADQLLDNHKTSVDNMDELSAITVEESQLATDWNAIEDDINVAIDEITADCEPDGDGKDLIKEMEQTMDQIHLYINLHIAAHDQHMDCEECYADEIQLRDQTQDRIKLMSADCDKLQDKLQCRDRDGDGPEPKK